MPKSSPDISKEPKSQGNLKLSVISNIYVRMYMFISSIVCSFLPFLLRNFKVQSVSITVFYEAGYEPLPRTSLEIVIIKLLPGFISVSRVLTDVRYRCWTSVVFTTRTKLWREATQRSPFHRILKKSKIWKFFGKTPSRSLWETLRSSCSRPSASPQPTILTGVDIHSRLRN